MTLNINNIMLPNPLIFDIDRDAKYSSKNIRLMVQVSGEKSVLRRKIHTETLNSTQKDIDIFFPKPFG